MELKDQVVPLEMAKRLKELGVTAESYFHWQHYPEKVYRKESIGIVTPLSKEGITDPGECWPAYTASELGEMLPCESGLIFWDVMYNDHIGEWYCRIHDLVKELKIQKEVIAHEAIGDTMAEAMADALIHCLENKLVTP